MPRECSRRIPATLDRAIDAYQAWLEKFGEDAEARREWLQLLERAERWPDLALALEAQLERVPPAVRAGIWARLGQLRWKRLGAPAAALAAFQTQSGDRSRECPEPALRGKTDGRGRVAPARGRSAGSGVSRKTVAPGARARVRNTRSARRRAAGAARGSGSAFSIARRIVGRRATRHRSVPPRFQRSLRPRAERPAEMAGTPRSISPSAWETRSCRSNAWCATRPRSAAWSIRSSGARCCCRSAGSAAGSATCRARSASTGASSTRIRRRPQRTKRWSRRRPNSAKKPHRPRPSIARSNICRARLNTRSSCAKRRFWRARAKAQPRSSSAARCSTTPIFLRRRSKRSPTWLTTKTITSSITRRSRS